MRRVRVEAGVGVVVVVALTALAAVSFQGHEEPSAQSRLSSRVPHLLPVRVRPRGWWEAGP